MNAKNFLLLAALACAATVADAQVYKCKDANGRTIYSQTAPANGKCEATSASGPRSSGADGGNLNTYAKEVDKVNAQRAEEQKKTSEQAAKNQQACERAREELAMLQQAQRIFTMNAKGERVYASDAEKDAATQKAQLAIAANCQ